MGVYSFGSNPQAWAQPIAGGISAYRKKKAAEELAAKKAAEKARKAAAKAQKKALKDKATADKAAREAKEKAEKLSREQSGGLVKPTGGSDLSISDKRAVYPSGFDPNQDVPFSTSTEMPPPPTSSIDDGESVRNVPSGLTASSRIPPTHEDSPHIFESHAAFADRLEWLKEEFYSMRGADAHPFDLDREIEKLKRERREQRERWEYQRKMDASQGRYRGPDKPTGTVKLQRAPVVDPKSQPSVKFLRGYSERHGEAPDPYQGYASPGHYKASADRFGDLSYSDQTPLSAAAAKRIMTIEELAALKGSKSKTNTPLPTLPGQDLTFDAYDKQRLRGFGGRKNTFPTQWSKARGAAGHQADEFYGVDETIRVNRAEQERAAAEAERASQLKTIRGFDSDAYAAQQRIDAEEAARVEAAIEKEKKDTAWFDIKRKITDKETAVAEKTIERETKGFGETGNIDWSNARRRELFELTKEDKAGLKEAGGDMPESGWPTPQVYAGLRGFPPQPIARERILAINEDFENDEKDAVTQNIMNIAEQQALYNGTTSREEFVKIQALIADGKLTVVNVVDNANGTMDASPVSEDGLREQLRATDPTYIDAGPNPVVRIDGVLYEKFGDQFFPLEEMMTDEGMDIGGLSSLPTTPTRGQFVPQKFNLDPMTTTGSDSYARSIFRS